MSGSLSRGAIRVLLANRHGGATVPAPTLYPHQWSWDSAFIAIGMRHLSARRAQQELESLFGAQWSDGRVPHIVFAPSTPLSAYFPGPDFWCSDEYGGPRGIPTSGLMQPPVHAIAVLEVFEADPETARRRGFLERIYPRLVAWHRYLTQRRDLGGRGIVSIVHPWESGMDNSPAWDEPLSRIAPVAPETFHRRDLVYADGSERPTDLDYGRYVRLATTYRDSGYTDTVDTHEFAVEDPLTNALLATAEAALATIATHLGLDPHPHVTEVERLREGVVEHLYDPDERMFFPGDVHTGRLIRESTVGGLIPLTVPGLPIAEDLVDTALGERFRPRMPGPPNSYHNTATVFEPTRYWRGPGWFNTGWLLWRGLLLHDEPAHAERLRQDLLDAVRRVGFREYVNPETGEGHGADDFSWTAALTLDLVRAGGGPNRAG